jgi:hypothetical protein
VVVTGGASGSGRLVTQRRRRNARSLADDEPKSAVPMVITEAAVMQMTMAWLISGWE